MSLTGEEFLASVERLARVWWPARSIVQQAVDTRKSLHASGAIVVLDSQCPWKDHLFEIEATQTCHNFTQNCHNFTQIVTLEGQLPTSRDSLRTLRGLRGRLEDSGGAGGSQQLQLQEETTGAAYGSAGRAAVSAGARYRYRASSISPASHALCIR